MAKQGIKFYRMDTGHILNKKLRLLQNEFQADGYYIWSCLLDYGYGKWGWYFDTRDEEEMELFASEYCRQKLTKINEVINGCLRRGLFDMAVFKASGGVLTSEMMQEVYVHATLERRKKGAKLLMQREWLLVKEEDLPGNIEAFTGDNRTEYRESFTNETTVNETTVNEIGAVGTAPPAKKVDSVVKNARRAPFVPPSLEQVKGFFVQKMGDTSKPNCWPEDRCHTQACAFWNHYEANGWRQGGGNTPRPIVNWGAAAAQWISRELRGTFNQAVHIAEKTDKQPLVQPQPALTGTQQALNYLYERFCEDTTSVTVVSIEHFHYGVLKGAGLDFLTEGQRGTIRESAKASNANASPEALDKMAKRIAVLELFPIYRSQGLTILFR